MILRLAVRNIWRNPKRSTITLSAIAVAVGGSVALSSLARGMSHQIFEDAIHDLTGHIQIHAPGYLDDPVVENSMSKSVEEFAHLFRGRTDIVAWAPRVRVPAVVVSERNSSGLTLVGIDPKRERGLSLAGDDVSVGQQLESDTSDGLVIGRKLAEDLETQVGRRIVLLTQGADGQVAERGFRVIGMFQARLESTESRFAFTGLRGAQQFLRMGTKLSEISILTSGERVIPSTAQWLQEQDASFSVLPWDQIQPFVRSLLKVQSGFLFIWLIIVVATVSFGLVNTLFMALFERIREIGMLQALGMKPKYIVQQVLLESIVLLFLGAVVGNVMSAILLWCFRGGIDISAFASGTNMFGLSKIIHPRVLAWDCVVINGVVLVLGTVASIYPARYAATLSPAEAFRKA